MSILHLTSYILHHTVVPGRLELPTSTLSVWRSNQLSYRTGFKLSALTKSAQLHLFSKNRIVSTRSKGSYRKPRFILTTSSMNVLSRKEAFPDLLDLAELGQLRQDPFRILQKGGVPAAPSGTATLLRLSPNHRFHPRPTLAVTDFRRPLLSWLDGRCVQGPGTYSPRHG